MGFGWAVNTTPRPLYPRERDPVSILQRAGWSSEPVWTGAENLASTGIWSPDRPAVASRYTNCAIPALSYTLICAKIWNVGSSLQLRVLLYLLKRNFHCLPLSLTRTLHCSNLSSGRLSLRYLLLFQWWIRYKTFKFGRVVAYNIEQTQHWSRIWQRHWVSEADKRSVGEVKNTTNLKYSV